MIISNTALAEKLDDTWDYMGIELELPEEMPVLYDSLPAEYKKKAREKVVQGYEDSPVFGFDPMDQAVEEFCRKECAWYLYWDGEIAAVFSF